MVLKYDVTAMSTAARDIGSLGATLDDIRLRIGRIQTAVDPDIRTGVEAVIVAWAAAFEVMAEDMRFLSQHITKAVTAVNSLDEPPGGV